MKARVRVKSNPVDGQNSIKITLRLDVTTRLPYAFIEGASDALNYPEGGVIAKSCFEPALTEYKRAHAIFSLIEEHLKKIESTPL